MQQTKFCIALTPFIKCRLSKTSCWTTGKRGDGRKETAGMVWSWSVGAEDFVFSRLAALIPMLILRKAAQLVWSNKAANRLVLQLNLDAHPKLQCRCVGLLVFVVVPDFAWRLIKHFRCNAGNYLIRAHK